MESPQAAFYFDGQIRVSWSSVKASAPFVGLSSGVPRRKRSVFDRDGWGWGWRFGMGMKVWDGRILVEKNAEMGETRVTWENQNVGNNKCENVWDTYGSVPIRGGFPLRWEDGHMFDEKVAW